MKKINILYCVLCVLLISSCYEDYTKDYNYSTAYFASQKPLRTVTVSYTHLTLPTN